MTTLIALAQMALVLAATAGPIAVAIRLLTGWTDDVDGLLLMVPMAWPRGVQEEEPQRWRFGAATV